MGPRLEAARLILRPFARADWGAVTAMLSDPINTQYMHFSKWTEQKRREWFERCLANAEQADVDAIDWAITLKGPETVIGWFFIGTSHSDCVGERSFGYLLDRTWWNRGYMTEALGVVLSFEFGALGTSRVHATCETANRASARVMEKVGMRREKTVHDADFEGNWAERHHYAITQGEYGELVARTRGVLGQDTDFSHS